MFRVRIFQRVAVFVLPCMPTPPTKPPLLKRTVTLSSSLFVVMMASEGRDGLPSVLQADGRRVGMGEGTARNAQRIH